MERNNYAPVAAIIYCLEPVDTERIPQNPWKTMIYKLGGDVYTFKNSKSITTEK